MAGLVPLRSAITSAAGTQLTHARPAPYSSIRNDALAHPDLIPRDVQVLAWLDKRARGSGRLVCSARDVAEALGCSVRTVCRSFARLAAAGLILRKRRYRLDGFGQAWDVAALTVLVGAGRRAWSALRVKADRAQTRAEQLAHHLVDTGKAAGRLAMTRTSRTESQRRSSKGRPGHPFVADEWGLSCADCSLPPTNATHRNC